jgi:hypothetical protein
MAYYLGQSGLGLNQNVSRTEIRRNTKAEIFWKRVRNSHPQYSTTVDMRISGGKLTVSYYK